MNRRAASGHATAEAGIHTNLPPAEIIGEPLRNCNKCQCGSIGHAAIGRPKFEAPTAPLLQTMPARGAFILHQLALY